MTATQTAARIGTRPSLGRRLLRRVPLLGAAIGVVLALWLVAANDVGAVADAFGRVGLLGIFAVVLVRVAIIGLCGVAWARVLTGLVGVAAGPFVLLRFVREGVQHHLGGEFRIEHQEPARAEGARGGERQAALRA